MLPAQFLLLDLTLLSGDTKIIFGPSSFYRATRMHSEDYAVARCQSIRLSVTCWYFVEMAEYILKLFHHRVATPF